MKKETEYRVCEKCHSIFNSLLEDLADKVSQSTMTSLKPRNSPVKQSYDTDDISLDPKSGNKLLKKLFTKIKVDIRNQQLEQIQDYLDVLLVDDSEHLADRFKKIKKILYNRSFTASNVFNQISKESHSNSPQPMNTVDNEFAVQNLLMQIETDSGLLGDDVHEQLHHFESNKLIELVKTQYQVNFDFGTEFKDVSYSDRYDEDQIYSDKINANKSRLQTSRSRSKNMKTLGNNKNAKKTNVK